jgi:hypothetical protein
VSVDDGEDSPLDVMALQGALADVSAEQAELQQQALAAAVTRESKHGHSNSSDKRNRSAKR